MKKSVKYNVYCKLTMDGSICGARCECAAGKSSEAHCKHVVMVLFGVEQMAQEGKIIVAKTCTETLQTFHQPKKVYTGSPVKIGSRQIQKSADVVDEETLCYRNYFRNLSIAYSFNCRMPLMQLIEPANPYAVAKDHDYCKESMETMFLKSLGLRDITKEKIKKIEEGTRSQRDSDLWHAERKIRITASNFYRCCAISSDEKGFKLAEDLLNPIEFCSNAMSHGIIYEKKAIETYEKQFDSALTVQSCGLYIVESHPYLAASPDGLVAELTVLEVKCPFSIKNEYISEQNLDYLSVDLNGNLQLKKNHKYFYQIQGQLLATGRQFCNFIIYTLKDIKEISISRDEHFITNMLSQLTDFYNKYFKPRLLKKYLYRNYYDYNFQQ